jgi:hypothetical protein
MIRFPLPDLDSLLSYSARLLFPFAFLALWYDTMDPH